jgi:hypothetical protein
MRFVGRDKSFVEFVSQMPRCRIMAIPTPHGKENTNRVMGEWTPRHPRFRIRAAIACQPAQVPSRLCIPDKIASRTCFLSSTRFCGSRP